MLTLINEIDSCSSDKSAKKTYLFYDILLTLYFCICRVYVFNNYNILKKYLLFYKSSFLKQVLLLVAVVTFSSNYLFATEYYISMTGIDSNSGTLAAPWKTIAKANASLKPGDTVYFRSGLYDGCIDPINSGTSAAYISYKAYPGETPIIDRSRILSNWQLVEGVVYSTSGPSWIGGVWEDNFEQTGYNYKYWPQTSISGVDGPGKYFIDTSTWKVYVWTKNGDNPNTHIMRTSAGNAVSISSMQYIAIDGIQMKWVLNGVWLVNCSHFILSNLNIQYASGYGIYFGGQSDYNKISSNIIKYIGTWYYFEGDGVYLSGHHNLVDTNDISFAGHNLINSTGANANTYNNIIQNNITHDSGKSGFGSNYNAYYEVWRNNRSYSNRGAGIQIDSNNIIVQSNSFYGSKSGVSLYTTDNRTIRGNRVFNNTFYNNNNNPDPADPSDMVIHEYSGYCTDNIHKNNITQKSPVQYQIFIDASQLRDNIYYNNNVYSSAQVNVRILPVGEKTLSIVQNTYPSNFANNISSDPLFEDPVNANFKIKSDSGNINKGCFLTTIKGSGSGKIISVKDAGYFCDGFGIAYGDLIQLQGTSDSVSVVKVDYNNQTIEIEKDMSWKDGDGISLPYSGSMPDIGAFEYTISSSPQSLRIIP